MAALRSRRPAGVAVSAWPSRGDGTWPFPRRSPRCSEHAPSGGKIVGASQSQGGPVMADVTMAQALNRALRDSLAEDDRTLVFGEDVGKLGGVFRITDGLQDEFGEGRVFDTPLAEAAIAGVSVGLAIAGWRPVVEMQFDGFSYPALDQIISHVAKYRYRSR